MEPWLLELLMCPHCRAPEGLVLVADGARLDCPGCGRSYPVEGGIPRFAGEAAGEFDNIAYHSNRWKAIQVDRLSGHGLSARRFFADSRWSPDWLRGKLVLDAGCGAGRFADIAAQHGARVVALDISRAVDACHELTRVHDGRVGCVQGSILELPLRPGAFDAVYCMGVIQHTPDPERAMRAMPLMLKPGGMLAYNFHEAGLHDRVQVFKHLLRRLTVRMRIESVLALSRALVAVFFPVSRALSRIRVVRQINRLLPIAAVHNPELTPGQQRTWTLLDTVDWYGARYEIRQDHRRVGALLRQVGLEDVESRPGLAWARKRAKA